MTLSAALEAALNGQATAQDVIQAIDEELKVTLIASGYDWVCPACDNFCHEIETAEVVTCDNCKSSFEVDDYYHAHP